jgi:predicted DNA-binding transcriptional regulator AlpA
MTLNTSESERVVYTAAQRSPQLTFDHDLLTVSEVARLLKVPISWVYGRTRRRGRDRLPCMKLGKYLRFSEREIVAWLDQIREI